MSHPRSSRSLPFSYQNVISENINDVEITPIFYSENGAVIVADPIHTSVSPLKILTPSQKSPFEKVLLDAEASRNVARYELLVESTIMTGEPGRLRAARALKIPNHSSHRTTIDTLEVVGEVENQGVENIEDLKILATFYDEQETVIGADYAYAKIDILVPGQTSPFSLSNYGQEGITKKIKNYRLCAEGIITSKGPYRELQIITHNPEVDELRGEYIVRGEVKNAGEIDATYVNVVATFYDSDGRIVAYESTYIDPRDLNSSQTESFRIALWNEELITKVVSYNLQVQCSEESDIWLSNLEIIPSEAEAGEEIKIMVDAKNLGNAYGTKTLTLTINGVVESTKDVTLSVGETRKVTFTVTKQEDGTYMVEVLSIPRLEDKFTVTSPLPWKGDIVLIAAAVIGGCSVIGVALYLRLRRVKSGGK